MQHIPLFRKGKIIPGVFATVDDEDYARLAGYRWGLENGRYAARWVRENGKVVRISMHREVVSAPPGMHVHHKNDRGLDNRRANLTICTHRQNIQFAYPDRPSPPGEEYVGAFYEPRTGRWYSRASVNGKRLNLGSYATPEAARAAYLSAKEGPKHRQEQLIRKSAALPGATTRRPAEPNA